MDFIHQRKVHRPISYKLAVPGVTYAVLAILKVIN
jgi:hypothetical protein